MIVNGSNEVSDEQLVRWVEQVLLALMTLKDLEGRVVGWSDEHRVALLEATKQAIANGAMARKELFDRVEKRQ